MEEDPAIANMQSDSVVDPALIMADDVAVVSLPDE
jgi:hypothetical protein